MLHIQNNASMRCYTQTSIWCLCLLSSALIVFKIVQYDNLDLGFRGKVYPKIELNSNQNWILLDLKINFKNNCQSCIYIFFLFNLQWKLRLYLLIEYFFFEKFSITRIDIMFILYPLWSFNVWVVFVNRIIFLYATSLFR